MNRNTDCPCLICNCSCNSLSDPPRSISTEFKSFMIIKLFYCLNQSQISLLNQVKEQHATTNISFCNTYYQTQVCFCQSLLCLLVPICHSFGQFNFFFCRQKRHLSNFLQIHTYRIFNTDSIWYRKINLLYINIIFV